MKLLKRTLFQKLIPATLLVALGMTAQAQVGDRWSVERSIIPQDMEATEANVVIQSDGSINVTFRGGSIENPELGGIYFTRSDNQGYSWMKPEPAVSTAGIVTGVTHQLQTDGDNLLLYVAVNRLARYELIQYLSTDRGQSWRETETVFSSIDPIRSMVSWRGLGRLYIFVITVRSRPTGGDEHTIWLVQGRASGAYWDQPVRVKNFFADSISSPQLLPPELSDWPRLYWRQDGIEDFMLQVGDASGSTWRILPLPNPPDTQRGGVMEDMGIRYRVRATEDRQLLFNRTDDQLPQTTLLTTVPSEVESDFLKLVWQGEDNYTLPSFLRFEVQLDESEPVIWDATSYEFEGLSNGSHRISITAIDEAQNRQVPPTVRNFRVQVPPVPEFVTPTTGDLLNASEIKAVWKGSDNVAEDAPLLFSLKIDDEEWGDWITDTEMTVDNLEDGEHGFFLRAKDSYENVSKEPATVRFEVDSEPPVSVVEELPRDWDNLQAVWPDIPNYKVEFRVTGRDNRTAGSDLEYRYKLDDGLPSAWMSVEDITSLSGLPDGTHKIEFETRDEAGNVQSPPTSLDFDFNTPPNTHLWVDDTNAAGRTYRFQGKDSNSNLSDIMFRWKIDEDGDWSDWTIETQALASNILKGVSHGEHVLYLQARDSAGNVDPTPAREIIEVDTIPPEPPVGIKVIVQDDGSNVDLRWESVSDAATYQVYRSNAETLDRSTARLVYSGPNTRTRDIPGREEHTVTYYYFITASDRSGNESDSGEVQKVEVLGNTEIRVKDFKQVERTVNTVIGSKRWNEVQRIASEAQPEIVPQAYLEYWKLSASAGMALNSDPQNFQQLTSAKTGMDKFIKSPPQIDPVYFEQSGEKDVAINGMVNSLKSQLDEVKSAILWIRLKKYGMFGAIALVVLLILFGVYKYIQSRKVTQMPTIRIDEGIPPEITPSKEALKDPTVLRRWAEVQADSNSAENWSRLAFAFHNIGELENAIQSLYKALEIEPENTRFHFQMGHFHKEIGNNKDAIRHFERYLELNPESTKSAEEVKGLLERLRKGED
ncbi:MAG: hypothetical protein KC994_02560 [Candidatus Omnitrophica bacterium]|nr:hypothetical protein [Candidatus Omnitrophota bacterium]